MGKLRLYALGIDEARDLFQGSPGVAERLRELAGAAFPEQPAPKPRRFRGRVRRRHGDDRPPAEEPWRPTAEDLAKVTGGHFVGPDRLQVAWTLARLWFGDRSWSSVEVPIDESSSESLDFNLAAAGVPPSASVRSLFNRPLQVPLQPPPGGASGYLRGQRAHSLRDAWADALPRLSPENAETAQQVVTWLGGLESWRDQARDAGRPDPDIIALYSR